MATQRRRRHYRVAEKETVQAVKAVRRVQKMNMRKYIAGAVAIGVLAFIKGLLIGLWIAKE